MSKSEALSRLREAIARLRSLAKTGDMESRHHAEHLIRCRNTLLRLHGRDAHEWISNHIGLEG